MALHLDPFGDQPLPGERKARAADIAHDWRVGRHGIELLAHGALVCPDCDAPIVVSDSLPAHHRLECGFCGHRARAREFLVRDVFDTLANEAYLIARLPT
jgi:hypothetical protein